ncbi:unnamed protein product, partial [Prorocentrum cordatum]
MVAAHRPGPAGDRTHPHVLVAAMARLLAAAFGTVRAFPDLGPRAEQPKPSGDAVGNVLLVASSAAGAEPAWEVPSTGYYESPREESHDWYIKHFAGWELFRMDALQAAHVEPPDE